MATTTGWPWRKITAFLIVIVLLLAVVGYVSYDKFLRELPAPHFASDEEHFLYGSIGTESLTGVPYWIWLVLPRLFPEYLPGPGGYASLGIPWQEGHEMPTGFAKVTVGFPRVGFNCAFCHTASWRANPEDPATIVATGPSHQAAVQSYLRFLFACARDPRFTAKNILAEINRNYSLPWLDAQLYRFLIIPFTGMALRKQHQQNAWMDTRPDWGRGRIDPFNPVKFGFLKLPVDDTIGNSDMEPVWNQKPRQGMSLYWDGLNTNHTEVVLSSALGDGTTKKWVDRDFQNWRDGSSLQRIEKYLMEVQAPKYPFPLDQQQAAEGKITFDRNCALCHTFGQQRTGTVIPINEVGTDRHRLDMWTAEAARAYNAYGQGHAWKFNAFTKTSGYVAVPLDGLWLRAPYLHNGSVPSLWDLLEIPEKRPQRFYRGYDVYDPQKVGFITEGPEAERAGFRHETSVPGNGNGGHLYGTDLSPAEKEALIEYLKAL
jgi:RoxA-like, cytochrome c-like